MDGSSGVRAFRTAETQRLDAFVDAAFAFAVSLLIIGGSEPLRSFADLATALARIPAFIFGFALIALFWSAHRTWSTLTPVRTGWTTFLSLAVVFAVLVFVFPLRLLAETATHYISGGVLPGGRLMSSLADLSWTYVIYGVAFAVLSGLNAGLFAHAAHALRSGDPAAHRKALQWATTWGIATGTGILSALVAVSPLLQVAPWLPGVAYNLIPIGVGAVIWNRRGG
ncbi:MAG: DUF1211 domain-containing protein [Brevundimonas sp.]|jgi:uncharacterized membrane protein|nr:MAG: DUF1211 domain-containing protein [Brevundimonas sp.]